MTGIVVPAFRGFIGQRIQAEHQLLTSRWLDELKQLVPVADEIFPSDELGRASDLIMELGACFGAPINEPITANAPMTIKATELGRLRHAQRASVHQVLREYRALRLVIARFIEEEADRHHLAPGVSEVLDLTNALDAAIEALLQTTIDAFVAQYTETITQHTTQLEGFNRMVTHELRQPLGTFQFALKLLGTEETRTDRERHGRILASAERNVTHMGDTLAKLLALSRADSTDTALVQRIDLSAIVADVIDQLREFAVDRKVEVRLEGQLPMVTVDRARLELALVNLISNAIKYSDPAKRNRTVQIALVPSRQPDVCTISIRDNGIGIADAEMQPLFRRFYRGHAERDRELVTSGLGLGLSIVADCTEALRGSLRLESTPGEGTTFFLELPMTRA
jgi:signal transduction histidine kinase